MGQKAGGKKDKKKDTTLVSQKRYKLEDFFYTEFDTNVIEEKIKAGKYSPFDEFVYKLLEGEVQLLKIIGSKVWDLEEEDPMGIKVIVDTGKSKVIVQKYEKELLKQMDQDDEA